MKKTTHSTLLQTALVFALIGCHCGGTLADDLSRPSADGLGKETFTFKGQLPENFGITAIVYYAALNPDSPECQVMAGGQGPGKFEVRRYIKNLKAPISDDAQSFSFDIALTHSVERCNMELSQIKLEIDARYGPQAWQTNYGKGGFRITQALPDGAPDFDVDGALTIKSNCEWMFQESKARSRVGQISKLINCSGAGAYLPLDRLADKVITLAIMVNPDEKPYYRDTWIKSDNGWKPCLPKPGGWITCQSPPIFKKFKMDGKTCTIYPDCTE